MSKAWMQGEVGPFDWWCEMQPHPLRALPPATGTAHCKWAHEGVSPLTISPRGQHEQPCHTILPLLPTLCSLPPTLASPWPLKLLSLNSPTYVLPSANVNVPAPAQKSIQHPHALPASSYLHALGIRPLACRCKCVCRLTHSKPIHACETVPSLEEATWSRGTPTQPHATIHHKYGAHPANHTLVCTTTSSTPVCISHAAHPRHPHCTGTRRPGKDQAISSQSATKHQHHEVDQLVGSTHLTVKRDYDNPVLSCILSECALATRTCFCDPSRPLPAEQDPQPRIPAH